MNDRVSESALVNDVHANPYVHVSENSLLVLLVLPCVVQEDAVQELLGVDVCDSVQLHWVFAVAAKCGLLLCVSARKTGVNDVLSSCKTGQFLVGIADVPLGEGGNVLIIVFALAADLPCNDEHSSGIARRRHFFASGVHLRDLQRGVAALCCDHRGEHCHAFGIN